MRSDLYRIDDVLLRAGGIAAVLFVLVVAGVVLAGLAASADGDVTDGPAALARHAVPLALAAACPASLLAAGFWLRRRERQVASVWSLLRQNAVLSVPELLASSNFTRSDLERVVRFLNDRGLAHYVWDRDGDTIQDGRLLSTRVHVEKCDACGSSVALELSLTGGEPPRCPFCHGAVSARSHEELRQEALEALRAEGRPEPPAVAGSRLAFSLGVFVLLLVVCWPAAIVYAVYTQRAR